MGASALAAAYCYAPGAGTRLIALAAAMGLRCLFQQSVLLFLLPCRSVGRLLGKLGYFMGVYGWVLFNCLPSFVDGHVCRFASVRSLF